MRMSGLTKRIVGLQGDLTDLVGHSQRTTAEALTEIVDLLNAITTSHGQHVAITDGIVRILETHAEQLNELSDASRTSSDVDAPSVPADDVKREVERLRHELRGLIDDDFPMLAE